MKLAALYNERFKLFLTITLLIAASAAVQAAPGDLDATFNGTGKTRLGFGFGDDYGSAVAVQTDGKLVVAGYGGDLNSTNNTDCSVAIARYNTDNSLDASFGSGGKVVTEMEAGDAHVVAMKIQADGKIVVAGSLINGSTRAFLVIRYNTDGSLDASFDADGVVIVGVEGFDVGSAMIIDPNGKIIVVGYTRVGSLLIRLTATGALDTTFNGDGKVVLPAGINGNAVTLQADGKIIVAGYAASAGGFSSAKLVRYHSTGALDTSFGSGGTVTSAVANTSLQVNAVAMQFGDQTPANPDKILVAGASILGSRQILVARYNLNGTLDTSFDGDGFVFTDIGVGQDIAEDLIVQRSGFTTRIFVAGYTDRNTNDSRHTFAVLRYNPNGSLNTAFDGDGIAVTSIPGGDSLGMAMTIQGGNVVVAGDGSFGFGNDFAVARYNSATGALDSTFDGDGIKIEDVTDHQSSVSSTAVQTDGKIVVAGYPRTPDDDFAFIGGTVFALARYNADGTLDASFGTGGKATTDINGYSGSSAVAIQTDGKIVVAGYAANAANSNIYGFAVARYNTNGTLDTSFGTGGFVVTVIGADSYARALAIQSDGKIVVAGYANNRTNFAVARYLAGGALDSSFDTDGIVITDVAGGQDFINVVKIQTDGKIVVAGESQRTTVNYNIAVVRYLVNGALDSSFGNAGKIVHDIGGSGGYGMAIQPDGKIVVTGSGSVNSNADLVVVRYLAGGALDASFDADGVAITAIGTGTDVGRAVAIEAGGKIVVAGYAQLSDSNYAIVAVRYHSTGALDNSYGSGGKVVVDVTPGIDLANAVALDSSGRAVIAGSANNSSGIIRLQGDFDPTAAAVTVSGRVLAPTGRGLSGAVVSLTDASGNARTARTTQFGSYRFDAVEAGQTYILSVTSKRYQFNPQIVNITEEINDLNFTAETGARSLF